MMKLLCTDLDRTLLPNGAQPESPEARALFSRFVENSACHLAYVSGRHLSLVKHAIKEYALPQPDFAITDVGARIYRYEDELWHNDKHWQEEIDKNWAVHGRAFICGVFDSFSELTLQENEKQSTHKISFYHHADIDLQRLQRQIEDRLARYTIEVSMIWSHDDLTGQGLLDVLPRSASKYHAISFLADILSVGLDQVVFAGDSGNDLEVLCSEIPSVLVANASAEVRDMAQAMVQENGHPTQLYLAHGGLPGEDLSGEGLQGMNGNYSAGILEGVLYYHPDMKRFIESGAEVT